MSEAPAETPAPEEETPEEETPAPEEAPQEAAIVNLPPTVVDARRGVGLDGEPSELMDPTPDQIRDGILNKPSLASDGDPEPILAGAWVRLADTDAVRAADPRVVGHVAYVSFAPVENVQDGPLSPRPHQIQAADAQFTVVTRDEYNLTIPGLTRADFQELSQAGRHVVVAHG